MIHSDDKTGAPMINRAQVLRMGERTNPAGKPVANKILLAISDSDYRVIRPHLDYVDLPHHFTLQEPREKQEFAYFLNSGLASIVVSTHGGRDVEAGVVGYEGVVGTALVVGLTMSPLREIVQIDATGFRISAQALDFTLQNAPGLQALLTRYAVLHGMQVAQTAACNRLHKVPQRLARWLLMAQDRVNSGSLPITHDFLATMLGTDRPSVTIAAAALQRKKAIRYTRGLVKVLNRKKLEASACECYRVVQELNGALALI